MITYDQEGNWKDVKRELPELRELIAKTPSLFLHELKRRNLVTEEEYWRAFTIPDAAMRADSILLPVMRRGVGKRRKLLEILEQQRSRERHFLDMLKMSHVCSPTLNPNSAHRRLKISADLSTATWNQADQPYSDHAERFESWEIVLCFENFSSGDHYWEVDVRASKNCYIGVACESIPRNPQEKSGRLGWNESTWAFVQWDSNYSARHNYECIPYPEIKHLQRVGVRLDFNAGKLSFYNASTMELLHSFDDIPSEPLFPAFQVNSGSVMIYEAQSLKNLTVDESREDIQICNHFANSGDHRTNNTNAEKGDSKDALLRTGMEAPSLVRELIGRIPAMLHHELLVQGLITQYEFSEVFSMPLASERVKFMIRRLNRKQEESPQVQEILREHREKQEAFLKMRRESNTCSSTLNPNTAHRNLQISADFKTVRTSTHTQPYPDNSGRFDHYQVVICSEKISSGRHYWEVDVRGSEKFNIGVTYDAIPRKGDDKACKIGCNEVSWSLRKWCNDYTALHNVTETNLSVRDAPKRVGVHLDWEAGVLSFYSADSMSLLHRFYATFDRELYPAMSVRRKSLSICPLPYADAHC
ncbi:tripartite motif-containing protein 72-like [Lethenteron reissneri]|uniref:tripartite motif-containing protein 72-like n=1 Tax=Lethenteron reissneri TaxID=7753 RepID=UPI002AB60A52|nr:tripartite motif-containing protein 72-like [Lethenteron reissneri]